MEEEEDEEEEDVVVVEEVQVVVVVVVMELGVGASQSVGVEVVVFVEVMLDLRVVTAAPFKLFTRAAALLRGVITRFLGGVASGDASTGLSLAVRLDATAVVDVDVLMEVLVVLMLAKVDTADAASVVMDAPPCVCGLVVVSFPRAAGEEVVDSPAGGGQPPGGAATPFSGLTSLELVCCRISGLFLRPACCCCGSSVVLPTGAVFPK